MTRAEEDVPVRRIVKSLDGRQEFVVEIYARRIEMRPKGSRSPAATVSMSWGGLYDRAMMVQAAAAAPARKLRVKRGMQL